MRITRRRFTLADIQLEHDRAMDRSDGHDRQRFDPRVCQCCGKDVSQVECLCDGLTWYMQPGGGVECEAHRLKRLIDSEQKRRFIFWRK